MDDRPAVHPTVAWLAAYAWRFLVIAGAFVVFAYVADRVAPVFVPVVIATFLSRALVPPNRWLLARGWRPGLAAGASVLGFLTLLIGVLWAIGVAVVHEADDLGPTVSEAFDDVEDWLVEDSPFDLDRADVDRFREEAADALRRAVDGTEGDQVVESALATAEVVLGVLVGLVVTFFVLKDGARFSAWFQAWVPEPRRALTSAMGARAWRTLGGYLQGAALLGLVEGTIIGVTLWLVGARLAAPMAALTFLAAFVPFVGALVAGVVATLVALSTAGLAQAAVVGLVALLVQQFDNELLAPVVYGRALELHPVVVLLSVLAGGAAFGLIGSFLAVPTAALVINVANEARLHVGIGPPPPAPGGPGPDP